MRAPLFPDPERVPGHSTATRGRAGGRSVLLQSACLRRKAGIAISSIPLQARAPTLAIAWLRALRHTPGMFRPS